jgi:hypothetical protein
MSNAVFISEEEGLPLEVVTPLLPFYEQRYSNALHGTDFKSPVTFRERTGQLLLQENLDPYVGTPSERVERTKTYLTLAMNQPGYGMAPPELSPDGLSIDERLQRIHRKNPRTPQFSPADEGQYLPPQFQDTESADSLQRLHRLHQENIAQWRLSLITPDNITQRAIQQVNAEDRPIDSVIGNHNFRAWASEYYQVKVPPPGESIDGKSPVTDPNIRRLAEEWLLSQPGSGDIIVDHLFRSAKGAVANTGGSVAGSIGVALTAAGMENAGQYFIDVADGTQIVARDLTDPRQDHLITANIAETAGGMAAFVIPGTLVARAGRLAGLGETSIALAATATTATVAATENSFRQYQLAIESGASQDDATLVAGLAALVGATGAIPAAQWALRLERSGPALQILYRMAVETTEATIQGSGQELANNLIAQQIYDKNRAALEGVAGAATLNASAASILSLLTSIAAHAKGKTSPVKYDDRNGPLITDAQESPPLSGISLPPQGIPSKGNQEIQTPEPLATVNSLDQHGTPTKPSEELTDSATPLYSGISGRQIIHRLLRSVPVSGESDPRIDPIWRQGYERALEEGRRSAAALGVRFTLLPASDKRLIFADHGRDGSIEIRVHPNAFDELWPITSSRPEAFKRLVTGILSEELTHAADLASQRDEWLKIPTSRRGNFEQYVQQDRSTLFHEIRMSREAATGETRATIDGALIDAYRLYFEGRDGSPVLRDAEKILSLLEKGHSRNVNHLQFAAEFVRMLSQVEKRGETTETGVARILDQVRAWVDRAIKRIKASRTLAQSGEMGPHLQKRLDEISQRMDGIIPPKVHESARPKTPATPVVTPPKPAEPPSRKNLYEGARIDSLLLNFEEQSRKITEEAAKGMPDQSLASLEARYWYEGGVNHPGKNFYIQNALRQASENGATEEEKAILAFSIRNAFRNKARKLMADIAEARNLEEKERNFTWKDIYLRYNGDYAMIVQKSMDARKGILKGLEQKNEQP